MPETSNDESYDRPARSALRHRPISAGEAAAMTDQPRIQRASRMRNTITGESRQVQGTQEPEKETTETFQPTPNQPDVKIQPQPVKPSKGNRPRFPNLTRFPPVPRRIRMIATIIAGIATALLIVFLYLQIANLATVTWDDLHYGRPRTFQVDAFVGHETGNTPSHFIALNLQGHIEIIELPGGYAAHTQEYSGPQLVGPNADLIPPTLQFVNTSNSHIKDMILQAGNVEVYYRNVQGTFRAS